MDDGGCNHPSVQHACSCGSRYYLQTPKDLHQRKRMCDLAILSCILSLFRVCLHLTTRCREEVIVDGQHLHNLLMNFLRLGLVGHFWKQKAGLDELLIRSSQAALLLLIFCELLICYISMEIYSVFDGLDELLAMQGDTKVMPARTQAV